MKCLKLPWKDLTIPSMAENKESDGTEECLLQNVRTGGNLQAPALPSA